MPLHRVFDTSFNCFNSEPTNLLVGLHFTTFTVNMCVICSCLYNVDVFIMWMPLYARDLHPTGFVFT